MAKIVVDFVAVTGAFITDVQRASRQFEREVKGMEATARQYGKAIGAAIAAGATGIATAAAAAVKSQINAFDELNKAAQKVSIPVETLSALKLQADLADTSMEQLQGGLVKLAKSAYEASEGARQQSDAYAALGVSVTDASGQLKSQQQLLDDVAQAFAAMPDGDRKSVV